MKRIVVGSLAVLLVAPAAALAQDRGFVRPLVGANVVAGPGAVFGATLGLKASPKVQIIGELGRMTNILPTSVGEQVEVAAALVANSLGGKHSSTASARATYGLGGVRVSLREVSGAKTFAEVGVGAANVRSRVSAAIRGSETLQGDISHLVTTPFTASTPDTKAMMSIGGGLILDVTRTMGVEMGCRYLRVFTKAPAIDMAEVFGGFRFVF